MTGKVYRNLALQSKHSRHYCSFFTTQTSTIDAKYHETTEYQYDLHGVVTH